MAALAEGPKGRPPMGAPEQEPQGLQPGHSNNVSQDAIFTRISRGVTRVEGSIIKRQSQEAMHLYTMITTQTRGGEGEMGAKRRGPTATKRTHPTHHSIRSHPSKSGTHVRFCVFLVCSIYFVRVLKIFS